MLVTLRFLYALPAQKRPQTTPAETLAAMLAVVGYAKVSLRPSCPKRPQTTPAQTLAAMLVTLRFLYALPAQKRPQTTPAETLAAMLAVVGYAKVSLRPSCPKRPQTTPAQTLAAMLVTLRFLYALPAQKDHKQHQHKPWQRCWLWLVHQRHWAASWRWV